MISLPLELQLVIVHNLGAIDIVHLEQVCRSLRDLIQESAPFIWKNVLYDHCIQNALFWPSFGHLETPEQVKHAATAPLRFLKSYSDAIAYERPMKYISQRIELVDNDNVNLTGLLRQVHPIPGGRFVLFLRESGMSIWDLSRAPQAEIVFTTAIENATALRYRNVVDNEIIHVIVEKSVDSYPVGFVPPDLDPPVVTSFEFLEIFLNDDNIFYHNNHSCFTLLHPEDAYVSAYSIVGTIIVALVGATTVIWDYVENAYASWNIGGRDDGENPAKICSNFEYVIYICDEGIYGVRMADLKPVTDGYVVVDDSAETRTPDFFLPHKHFCPNAEDDPDPIFRAIGLDHTRPIDGKHPMIYHFREIKGPATQSYWHEGEEHQGHASQILRMHRYTFAFNASDPSKSTITTNQSFLCKIKGTTDHPLMQNLFSNFLSHCGGKTAALWTEPALYCFISISDGAADDTGEVKLWLVPFIEDPHGLEGQAVGAFLCPGSCTGLAVWRTEVGDVTDDRLEFYHFS